MSLIFKEVQLHLMQGYKEVLFIWMGAPLFLTASISQIIVQAMLRWHFLCVNSDPVISQSVFYDNYGLDGNMKYIYLAAGDDNNITISYSSLTS